MTDGRLRRWGWLGCALWLIVATSGDLSAQVTISCGESVTGSLDAVGEQDWYAFAGEAGQVISLVVWETTNFVDFYADLYGPESRGEPLAANLRGESIIELPHDGVYRFRVREQSLFYTGDYGVSLEWIHPFGSQCDVTPIRCGETLAGSLEAVGEQDWYWFEGREGDVISLVALETTNFVDFYADLYGPESRGEPMLADLRGETVIELPSDGVYRFRVREQSLFYTGNYGVSLFWISRICDCNGNGEPDADDVASGRSVDEDGDGVPDECDAPPASARFVRGDANADGSVDISDAVTVLGVLFVGEPARVECEKAADVDDLGTIEVTDAIYLLMYLFGGGRPPPPPFPACGEDPTPDDLTCGELLPCPRLADGV